MRKKGRKIFFKFRKLLEQRNGEEAGHEHKGRCRKGPSVEHLPYGKGEDYELRHESLYPPSWSKDN